MTVVLMYVPINNCLVPQNIEPDRLELPRSSVPITPVLTRTSAGEESITPCLRCWAFYRYINALLKLKPAPGMSEISHMGSPEAIRFAFEIPNSSQHYFVMAEGSLETR